MNWLRGLFPWLFVLVLVGYSPLLHAKSVTLSWDPSPTSTVTGYKVVVANHPDMSGTLTVIDVSNVLTRTILDLDDTSAYWFGVKAYDGVGNESAFSNIVKSEAIPERVLPELEFIIDVEILK